MRIIIKAIFIQGFLSIVIAGIVYFITKSIVVGIVLLAIFLILIIIKPVFYILNILIKKTNWYKINVGDGLKFLKQIDSNLDICNLGSNSGKFAFSYDGTGLKGENWALGPQTLSYDFRILKNYFSYLKEGATVLIPICPFSSCIKDFENDEVNYKYYPFLHSILILNYSENSKEKVMRYVHTPFQVSPLMALVRLIKDVRVIDTIIMDMESIEKDADNFMNNWKRQFFISDLDAPVSDLNLDCIKYNTSLLSEMVSFCLERNLKPVIIIPPVTKALSSKLTDKFRENYIYSFIGNTITKHAPFLNYLDDKRFVDINLYLNSYYLNTNGRKVFTKAVLNDLEII